MLDREPAVFALTVISIVTFLGSLFVLPCLVARIPETYFLRGERAPTPWQVQHPVRRFLFIALKNLLGLVLFVGGILMLFLPGQGLLTLAVALLLLDYPGKYRFERWLVSRPTVLRGLNWLRRRRGCPPLVVEE